MVSAIERIRQKRAEIYYDAARRRERTTVITLSQMMVLYQNYRRFRKMADMRSPHDGPHRQEWRNKIIRGLEESWPRLAEEYSNRG